MDTVNKLIGELIESGDISGLGDTNVGTEAISFAVLRTHFDKVNDVARKLLGNIKVEEDNRIVSLSLKEITLKREILDAGYITLAPVEVYKPGAFTGNVHDFVQMMDKLHPSILTLTETLTQFEATLAKFIHEPELLTKPCTGLKRVKLDNGRKTLDSFSDFFMGRSGIDKTAMGNLYGNMRQVVDTGTDLLKLTEKFNGTDIKDVRTRGDALYTTLSYVEDELSHRGLEMTDKWRKAIGNELYRVTEWLGIYSLFISKLIAVSVSHRDTVTKLNNI